MNQENIDHLFRQHPLFFRGHNRKDNLLHEGILCGDGWFHLIEDLADRIEEEIVRLNMDGVSRRSLPRAIQVKEKFGTLRIYTKHTAGTEIGSWIIEAEQQSAKTCEQCGATGELRRGGCLATLCVECNSRHKS
jgi:hypothetical protein